MRVKRFTVNPIQENCYVVSKDSAAVIIDCGAYTDKEWEGIERYIHEERLTLLYALQTHGHFDHVFGTGRVEQAFGLKTLIHHLDQPYYLDAKDHCEGMFGLPFPCEIAPVGGYLDDGQTIDVGGKFTIHVLHTPGHTPGGVCLYIPDENILFSGDTLFLGSLGRADLPGGDMQTEIESIRERLFTLPPATKVYPGHGPHTTIEYEKHNNMYVR